MSSENKMYTYGDKNINLQDIKANNINIITGKEVDDEVKEKKIEIAKQIATLINQLSEFSNSNIENDLPAVENDEFGKISWDEIVTSINLNQCILFIGPEISLDENGKSIHNKFYNSLLDKNIYSEEEGFFNPGVEKDIKLKVMNFYKNDFPKENVIGERLLEKLLQIPFNYIVSVGPDNTISKIFNKYEKKHISSYFNGTKLYEDGTKLKKELEDINIEVQNVPFIYNFFGNPEIDGNYIFTHKKFHEYINQPSSVKIPSFLETKVQEAVQYLFIGFDFEKWYFRLILFYLNLNASGYSLNTKNIDKAHKDFLDQQFSIISVNANCEDFIKRLNIKYNENYTTLPLINNFIDTSLSTLKRIELKAKDSTKLEKLTSLDKELLLLEEKIDNLKNSFQHEEKEK